MKDLAARLSRISSVQLRLPVSPAEMLAVEAKYGIQLPEEVREFYLICDGAELGPCLEIPTLDEACGYFQNFESNFLGSLLGVVNFESDPFCIFHSGPLRGYVARIFHDGDSHVRWRTFSSLLEQIALNLDDDGQLDEGNLSGELDSLERLEKDVLAGHAMVELAKSVEPHTSDCPLAFGLAFDLLGENQVSEIASFIDHEDVYVGEAARDRLAVMTCAEAKTVLRRYQTEMVEMVKRIESVLKAAGIQVAIINDTNIRIDPGPKWLNTGGIMTERHRTDFDEWVLSIARR